MSPLREDEPRRPGDYEGRYVGDAPRSIFSAFWFRVILVVLVLGLVAVWAVPYVLDLVSPPTFKQTAVVKPPPSAAPPPAALPEPAPTTAGGSSPAPPGSPGEGAQPGAPPSGPAEPSRGTAAPPPLPAPDRATAVKPAPPAPERTAAAKSPAVAPDKASSARASRSPILPSAAAPTRSSRSGGEYWVQVGAYRSEGAAKQLASRLRGQKFPVSQSVVQLRSPEAPGPLWTSTPPAQGDLYNVFVTGTAPGEINPRLAARGLTSESVAGGVIVKPSLPLRDAVELSKELALDSWQVQVRRASGSAPKAAAADPASTQTFYRVRVGGYPDRAAAMAVLQELEAKGYQPFLARGEP